MKVSYLGYDIDVTREKCMAGYPLVYYSIFRQSDGYECTSGYSDSADTVRTWIRLMKERVDNELLEKDPWEEHARDIPGLSAWVEVAGAD